MDTRRSIGREKAGYREGPCDRCRSHSLSRSSRCTARPNLIRRSGCNFGEQTACQAEGSSRLPFSRHSPDTRRFRGHNRACEWLGQGQIAVAAGKRRLELAVDSTETPNVPRLFAPGIPLSSPLPGLTPRAPHGGAGGARSRPISDRIGEHLSRHRLLLGLKTFKHLSALLSDMALRRVSL